MSPCHVRSMSHVIHTHTHTHTHTMTAPGTKTRLTISMILFVVVVVLVAPSHVRAHVTSDSFLMFFHLAAAKAVPSQRAGLDWRGPGLYKL